MATVEDATQCIAELHNTVSHRTEFSWHPLMVAKNLRGRFIKVVFATRN